MYTYKAPVLTFPLFSTPRWQVGDRRHGNNNASVAMTMRSLYSHISKRFDEWKAEKGEEETAGQLKPSLKWFQYQFLPTRSSDATSDRYTGRFDLNLKCLCRTARSRHEDEHYCAAGRRYLKHGAVMFRDVSIFVSMDDKCNIPVGDPGKPMAVVERGRKVLMRKGHEVEAMDHA